MEISEYHVHGSVFVGASDVIEIALETEPYEEPDSRT